MGAWSARFQIIAWDPVQRKEVWRVRHPLPWNGGMLATAGNLVFQGNSVGEFAAYAADSGEKLWATAAQTGIVASPVTYEVGGEQYVSVLAGWGGSLALSGGEIAAATGVAARQVRAAIELLEDGNTREEAEAIIARLKQSFAEDKQAWEKTKAAEAESALGADFGERLGAG